MSRTEEEMARDFTLSYDGPAFERGNMPARELAAALVALGDIFQEAVVATDPDAPPVEIEIRAISRSAFDVSLHLAQSGVVNFLTRPEVIAAQTLIGIVAGFFTLLKVFRGKPIEQAPQTQVTFNADTITVSIDQSTHYTFPATARHLYDSRTARENARAVVDPLQREGVDVVKIENSVTPMVAVEKADFEAFTAEMPAEEEGESAETLIPSMPLVIVQPALEGEAKWRFRSGELWIRAEMKDVGYLRDVHEARDGFFRGDTLIADVVMKTWPAKPLKSPEWKVVKVHQHLRGSRPTPPLPISDDEVE